MNKQKFTLALVTGASSGIGEELCHLLASKGIGLIITGRNTAKLEHLANSLKSTEPVIPITADLSDPMGVQIIIDTIHEHCPDLVINNAGYGLYGAALSHSTDEGLKLIEVNVAAVLELSLEAARTLIAQNKKGVIMNVSSVAAFLPFPNSTVYAASKSFVTHFSMAFDYELQDQGIRVLNACPGMVKTEFAERAGGAAMLEEQKLAMTAKYAAEQIWWQIQKGKLTYIFDWKYRWLLKLANILPTRLVMRLVGTSIARRISSSILRRP
jgi:short-subunit dehydrogenase